MSRFKKLALATLIPFSVLCVTVPSVAAEPAAQVQQQTKPTIYILATGGTIAGTASSATQMATYKAGALGVDALINAVPEILTMANIKGEQVANIASSSLTVDIWLKLAKRINELLKDDSVDGVVITHGTDTLDETAYFLNLVVKSDKPVVIVGAMRPATAISADGPVNILNAVKLASSKSAKGKGVLIAMNDVINGARDVLKTNTLRVDTFKNHELGYLGYFENGEPVFYKQSSRKHTTETEFDITDLQDLPRVDFIYSHVNDDGKMAESAVANGAKGIVHIGTGNGSIHANTMPTLAEIAKKGVVIARAARVPYGPVIMNEEEYEQAGFIQGGTLSPQKVRILLQLALTKTNDPKVIAEMFKKY